MKVSKVIKVNQGKHLKLSHQKNNTSFVSTLPKEETAEALEDSRNDYEERINIADKSAQKTYDSNFYQIEATS